MRLRRFGLQRQPDFAQGFDIGRAEALFQRWGPGLVLVGRVLPGVRTTVSRLDPANTGQFEIRGQRLTEVEIVLTLPAALISASGRTMPLEFGPGDGGISSTNVIGASTAFDPRNPVRWPLSNSGRAYVFLGGSAVPASTQAGGTYQATVVLTVAYTGN